jgi:hypothetical protein
MKWFLIFPYHNLKQSKDSYNLYQPKKELRKNLAFVGYKSPNLDYRHSQSKQKSNFFIHWISPILCLGFPDLSLDFALFIFGFC